jgi:hypothetical protein
MTTITAYPLCWPAGWARTKNTQISRYGDRSLAYAREAVSREVRLLGGSQLVISSNLELRNDGLPRSGQRQPQDKGVAVYFQWKQQPVAFACDKWQSVEDNMWGIFLGLASMRQMERCGMSEMLNRAFTGFAALPAPATDWWAVLGVSPQASADDVRAAYRELVKRHHPDAGGDREMFERVTRAYEQAGGK